MAVTLVAAPLFALAGQLPLVTAPTHSLRIELFGSFFPNDRVWVNGARTPLGDLLQPTLLTNPLQSSLSQLLGHNVSDANTGITTIASREHGIGEISLGYGLTRRITIFGVVPVVYVRSRSSVAVDSLAASNLGINPASVAGDANGQVTTASFFTQFDQAISTLQSRINQGAYASDPTLLTLAQQTLTTATAQRAGLYALLADPARASVIVPTAASASGSELLGRITQLQSTLNDQLAISGFSAAPALPAQPLSSTQLSALLGSTSGFGYTAFTTPPHYGIGDIRAGLEVQVLSSGRFDSPKQTSVWVRGSARFPTGAAADPSMLLDQPTGSRHPAGMVDGIVDVRRHAVGVRAELGWTHAIAANTTVRVGPPTALLVPAAGLAAVRTRPGDSLSIAIRPYLRFAPHLGIVLLGQYWTRGSSSSQYANGQLPVLGESASVLDQGSAADALTVGVGIAYSQQGPGRDGVYHLPVEAGWSVERIIHSGSGVFPDPMTTRVYLRIYRPLFAKTGS